MRINFKAIVRCDIDFHFLVTIIERQQKQNLEDYFITLN